VIDRDRKEAIVRFEMRVSAARREESGVERAALVLLPVVQAV
jgi:hypothetical protein